MPNDSWSPDDSGFDFAAAAKTAASIGTAIAKGWHEVLASEVLMAPIDRAAALLVEVRSHIVKTVKVGTKDRIVHDWDGRSPDAKNVSGPLKDAMTKNMLKDDIKVVGRRLDYRVEQLVKKTAPAAELRALGVVKETNAEKQKQRRDAKKTETETATAAKTVGVDATVEAVHETGLVERCRAVVAVLVTIEDYVRESEPSSLLASGEVLRSLRYLKRTQTIAKGVEDALETMVKDAKEQRAAAPAAKKTRTARKTAA